MALREKLEVIVDANVGGFVSGMDRAAAAADKGLGKTDDRLQVMAGRFTTWGAAAAGAGAVAAVGLGKLAMMAADAERQQLKLTNSIANSSQKFNANGAALREQASALQKVTAAEDDAIVGAQSMLVQFGLTEDQVKSMTPLVVDLSRKMGIDLDTAAKAVGRSATGSTTALKRMGIDVNALGEGATDAERTVSALSKAVGGFAEAEGQTFAGQLEIIKNQLGEIGEGIGGGILDVVKPLTDLGASVSDVNPQLLNMVGRFATVSTAAVTAGGGLLFVAGQALKAREAFFTVSGSGDTATRSLNNFGKVAAGLGVAGAAASVYALGRALEVATANAAGFDTALKRASSASTPRELARNLQDAASATEGLFDKINNFNPVNQGLLDPSITVGPEKLRIEVDNLKDALDRAFAAGRTDEIKAYLDLLSSGVEFPDSTFGQKDLNNLLNTYRENLAATAAESNAAGASLQQVGTDAAAAASGFQVVVDESGEVISALQELNDAVSAGLDPVFAVTDALQDQAQAKVDVVKATAELAQLEKDGKQGTEEYAAAQQKLADANRGQVKSTLDLQTATSSLATAVANNPALFDAASAALDSWVASGQITAEQAQIMRTDILGAVTAAQEADRTRAKMEVEAEVATALFNIELARRAAVQAAQGDYTLTIKASIGGLISQLNTVQTIAQVTAQTVANIKAGGAAHGAIRMAAGGMLPDSALIMPAQSTPLVQWAEPETGGEAFIPLAPSKRKRSKDIWWETGRRLGVIGMAAGGFTADEPWGQYAEAMENAWQATFDAAPLRQQISLALKARDGYAKFSDEWVRFNRLLQDTKGQLAAQNADLAENQFEFNYERSTPQNQLLLAQQRLRGLTKFSDEWVRWTEEIERIRADMSESLTPSRGGSTRGSRAGGEASINITVNVNGPAAGDPYLYGKATVDAIREYVRVNGTAGLPLVSA